MAEETAERYYGRRAARYWFIDGLPELAFGTALFVCGNFGLVWGERPEKSMEDKRVARGNIGLFGALVVGTPHPGVL